MDFLSWNQLIIDCAKLMPVLRLSHKQKPHLIIQCKVRNIVNTHSGYTCTIPCAAEIDTDGVIDIIERLIKPTVGLPLSVVFDQDPLCMSSKLQEWLQVNAVRHKVSSTYHTESDGQTERKNKEISEMFTAA